MHKDLRPLVEAAKASGWEVRQPEGRGNHSLYLHSPDGRHKVPLTSNIHARFGLASKIRQLEGYGIPVRAYIRGELKKEKSWQGHEDHQAFLQKLDLELMAEGEQDEDVSVWVTVSKAAEILGYTPNYVNMLVKQDKLQYTFAKLGSDGRMINVRVNLESVNEYKQSIERGVAGRNGQATSRARAAKRLEMKPVVVDALEIRSATKFIEEVQSRLLGFYDELEIVKARIQGIEAKGENEEVDSG